MHNDGYTYRELSNDINKYFYLSMGPKSNMIFLRIYMRELDQNNILGQKVSVTS